MCCIMRFDTHCDRVSQCCHHLDVCWSQLVNYKHKRKTMNRNITQCDIHAAASGTLTIDSDVRSLTHLKLVQSEREQG